jgi:hypothetical protein
MQHLNAGKAVPMKGWTLLGKRKGHSKEEPD